MGATTGIEWAEATWNPVTGCDRVSPGCDHCYALTLARRLKAMGNPRYQVDGRSETSGAGFGLSLHHDQVELPLTWRAPKVVFVNSMSDLFHPAVPEEFIAAIFEVMGRCPQHTFQVLTKRTKRMAGVVGRVQPRPLPNVWLGTSVESAEQLWRADALRATPADVRFLSLEPLLGPLPGLDLRDLHWVITGGESGAGARPIDDLWVREIRDECLACGVAFFHKQWGGRTPKAGGRILDGRTWDQMPEIRSASADRDPSPSRRPHTRAA